MLRVLAFIRAVYPLILIISEAYRYGVDKYGDGTWKEMTASEHLDKAVGHMVAWKKGETDKPVLIDACLRLMFAASLAITFNQQPKEYLKDETQ